jgi:ubiquinone/menaquinone biosynthesis C-methylase UbiE
MPVFDSLSSAEQARQLKNPEGEVGLAVAAWLNETNRRGTAQVLAALGLEPRSQVLEIGFGNGRAVPDVLAVARDGRYAGIDISPTMVEEAKRFNAELVTGGRAEFHCAGAERMPFPNARFDRAFSIGVIHFWPEPVVALKEVRRVLKPNGSPSWAPSLRRERGISQGRNLGFICMTQPLGRRSASMRDFPRRRRRRPK